MLSRLLNNERNANISISKSKHRRFGGPVLSFRWARKEGDLHFPPKGHQRQLKGVLHLHQRIQISLGRRAALNLFPYVGVQSTSTGTSQRRRGPHVPRPTSHIPHLTSHFVHRTSHISRFEAPYCCSLQSLCFCAQQLGTAEVRGNVKALNISHVCNIYEGTIF